MAENKNNKIDLDELSEEQIKKILTHIQNLETFNKLDLYYPDIDTKLFDQTVIYARDKYPAHLRFFEKGKDFGITFFMSGNQSGKSHCLFFEAACHMTGLYPRWWCGHRFTKPIRVFFGAYSADLLKKTVQPKMLGQSGSFGSGMIPRKVLDLDSLKDAKKAETPITAFRVRHVSGGYSTASLKTYEAGRKAWEAESVDLIVMDEEPPMDVFQEAIARTLASKGIIRCGFTPNAGMTETVDYLTDHGNFEEGEKPGDIYLVRSSVYEVPHISKREIERLKAAAPQAHVRDARLYGIPGLGEGLIYPVDLNECIVQPFKPNLEDFVYCMAIDFGQVHPTAVLWVAYNFKESVYYIIDEHRESFQPPEYHANEINVRDQVLGCFVHKICDPSKGSIDPKSGYHVAQMYQDYEVEFGNANNDVDTGIYRVLSGLQHGYIKIFSTCTMLIGELRTYMYDKKGGVRKKNDDLCDCLRYIINEPVDNYSNKTNRMHGKAQDVAAKLMKAQARNRLF